MQPRSHDTWAWCFFLAGAICLGGFWSPGCNRTKPPEQVSVEQHLRALGVAYGRYVAQHRGEAPKDEAAFREYLTQAPDVLKMMNVNSPDEAFESARDKQKIVLRYGVAPKGVPGESKDVIAYESKGRDGKRFVVYPGGKLEEVDEATFRGLVPGA